jgi:hypothetical protein
LLLLPGAALAVLGTLGVIDGLAHDAAIPVPSSMVANVTMPKAAYIDAAAALAAANSRDGNAAIARAEAGWRAGMPAIWVQAVLTDGLSHDPASARGWTLLSESVAVHDRRQAAKVFSLAVILAPRDYWLVAFRTRDAAQLWPDLDAETRSMALGQARLLWQEPVLRPHLRKVVGTSGAKLVNRAFEGEPDTIRRINRWLSQQSRSETQR